MFLLSLIKVSSRNKNKNHHLLILFGDAVWITSILRNPKILMFLGHWGYSRHSIISSSIGKDFIVWIEANKECPQITHPCVFKFLQVLLHLTTVHQHHLQWWYCLLHVPLVVLPEMSGQTTGSPVSTSNVPLVSGPPGLHILGGSNIICRVVAVA